MADKDQPTLPPPSVEHRAIAAKQFHRANQVLADGQHDYGIQLLLTCCKLEPGNLMFRQALRRAEKAKYNQKKGSAFAALTTSTTKARIKSGLRSGEYVKVLELGEDVLTRNPWDVGTQMDMAEAADRLGQLDLACWLLIECREKDPNDPAVNRALAKLFEKRGNFAEAIKLWALVRQALPADLEASHKAQDLAANHTIARGQYEKVAEGQAVPRGVGRKEDAEAAGRGSALIREEATLKTRIDNDPANAHAYLQLSDLYRRHSRYDEARTLLQQGLEATGNHYDLAVALAELDIEPFRRNLALTDEKLADNPDDAELRKLRAKLLREINARELDLFRTKADRNPGELQYRLELGIRLSRAGQLDEAIRELQAARGDQRFMWKALMYLGYCFRHRNNWRLAKRNFEEALQHLPPSEEASRKEVLYQLAQGCAEAGDLTAAIDLGHELANLDFSYRDIAACLDDWQARVEEA